MKALVSKVRAIANRPRVMHYADIFLAAFAVELVYERDQILGAHGLNALGCLAAAASVAGGKAVIEAYRKSVRTPAPPAA